MTYFAPIMLLKLPFLCFGTMLQNSPYYAHHKSVQIQISFHLSYFNYCIYLNCNPEVLFLPKKDKTLQIVLHCDIF